MVRAGILTPEEALALFAALEDGGMAGEGKASWWPAEEVGEASVLQGFRVKVSAIGANLGVVGVPCLPHPKAEGGVLPQEGGTLVYRISLGDGELRVPEGSEVFLEAKGSNVERTGVVLKGQALGTNLEAERLLGLDLGVNGGNLEAGLALQDGVHRLEVQAGNAELHFLPGSDLVVEAQVRLGGLKMEGPWYRIHASGGQAWVLGEGRRGLGPAC